MSKATRQERKAQRLQAQAEDAEILAAMDRGDDKTALRLIHEQHGSDCGCANCTAYAELLTAEKAKETTMQITERDLGDFDVPGTPIGEAWNAEYVIQSVADFLEYGCPSCTALGVCELAVAPIVETLERSDWEELRSIGRDLRLIVAMLEDAKQIPTEPFNHDRLFYRQSAVTVVQAALGALSRRFDDWLDALPCSGGQMKCLRWYQQEGRLNEIPEQMTRKEARELIYSTPD
jgi:hypothetical protein